MRRMADPPLVPLDAPTVRANQSAVFVDGGSFAVNLYENRPDPRVIGPAQIQLVEVGRYAMSPMSVFWLRRNLDDAIAQYEKIMGHPLPDPTKIGGALASEAAENILRPPPSE
jgi:hypothetical protein